MEASDKRNSDFYLKDGEGEKSSGRIERRGGIMGAKECFCVQSGQA